jgi:hypothetical protein
VKKLFQFSLMGLLMAGANPAARGTEPAMTVAVYDFTATTETDLGPKAARWNASLWNARQQTARDIGPDVTALVTADLASDTNLVLVERSQLSKALAEQAFGASGMVNSDAAAKIGELTGARVLVAGQVIKTGEDGHLVVIADVIGTETGRLFADKVEGAVNDLSPLTSDLSAKISRTILAQATNLVTAPVETHDQLISRIVKSVAGTNRPAVSVNIFWPNRKDHNASAEGEFGAILLKAGFPVVDSQSDRKPDIEITGVGAGSAGPRQGQLFSFRTEIDLKVQERRTGNIMVFDHQEDTATDVSRASAGQTAQINAVDGLAERILPMLAQ